MSDNTTVDNQKFTITWGKFIPMIIGVLIATNTVTGILYVIEKNTENIDYNYKRSNRKHEDIIKTIDDKITIARLEEEIVSLKDHNELRKDIRSLHNRITLLEVDGSDQ